MSAESDSTHTPDRSHWRVLRCEDLPSMSRQHTVDWQALPPSARSRAAWDLVVEAWKAKGRDPDELRLQRSLAVFRRG